MDSNGPSGGRRGNAQVLLSSQQRCLQCMDLSGTSGLHRHALVALIFFPQGIILDTEIAFRPMKTRFEYLYPGYLLISPPFPSSSPYGV